MKEKKWKKTFNYNQCLKKKEAELTWDLFIQGLNEHLEFCFYYKDLVIDIAFHFVDKKKVYELNISNNNYYEFASVDELVSFKALDGLSIRDIWCEIYN